MAEKYSAEWLKQRALEQNAHWLDHHNCGICWSMVGYSLGECVQFHSACDCSSYHSPPQPSSWEEIAEWFAMQSSDEIRDRLMGGFHA